MIDEMFLWSAMCSANTTKATGTYAIAIDAMYEPSSSEKPPFFIASKDVNLGTAKIVAGVIALKASKLMIWREVSFVLIPITVKTAATAYSPSATECSIPSRSTLQK